MIVDVARSALTRAVTVVVPGETAVTTPVESTTAAVGLDEVHSTPLGAVTERPKAFAVNVSATVLVTGTVPPMKIVLTDGDNASASPGGANGSVSESLEQAMHVATIANLASIDRATRMESPI
jgi:hypothetical protein